MRLRATAAVLVPLLAAVLAAPADARSNAFGGTVLRFPSGTDFDDLADLNREIRNTTVGTIIFVKDVSFAGAIEVFRRKGLELCGATNRAADTVIEGTAAPTSGGVPVPTIRLDEVSDIRIRNLTIRATDPGGQAVLMIGSRSSTSGSFSRDVTLRSCRLEARFPLGATVRAESLDVADCTFTVTQPSGVGLLWQDGPALLVTRSRFETVQFPQTGDVAAAALRVFGTGSAESEGERARTVILTRNRVAGDFAIGFDLADVTDARVLRNTIVLPSSFYDFQGADAGRVGVVVQRIRGSKLPDDFEIRRNRVSGPHTGISCVDTAAGMIVSNDLAGCGSRVADEIFQDTGSAVRVTNRQGGCLLTIRSNDFRSLRSPLSAPAVVSDPPGTGGLCFEQDGEKKDQDTGNRVDPRRPLHD